MRMRIYHNYENNELSAYVLADEGRALSGQKKGIREALPECVTKLQTLRLDRSASNVATIYADGYGAIVVTWHKYNLSDDVQLHAGSRERLCNRKLVRNKDVEARTSDADGLAEALAKTLRNESACRRANDLETVPRFEYPAESRDCKHATTWQGTRWTHPRPLVETLEHDAGTDADMADNDAQAETVVVEPVEVEHDGVVDVELAETSETIPVVEAELEPADGSSEGNRRFRLYRNGNHYQLVVNPPAILLGNMVDIATAIGAYIAGNIERERSSNVYVYVRGLGEFMLRLSFNKQRNLYFCETKRESMFSFIWSTLDYQAGPRNGLIGTIMRALDADSERIRKATGPVTFASFEYLVATVEQKNGYSLVDSPDKASLDALNTLDWRDVETEETATEACSAVVPRAVESAPTLPAECSAETVEIPEVPPQTNEDARVLAVSEVVIPGGMSVGEMFPSVPYRAVRAFKRVVGHADGTVSRKKVAYAFRVGDVVQVLRRDRYVEAGADKAVESEIAAYVAKLRKAA